MTTSGSLVTSSLIAGEEVIATIWDVEGDAPTAGLVVVVGPPVVASPAIEEVVAPAPVPGPHRRLMPQLMGPEGHDPQEHLWLCRARRLPWIQPSLEVVSCRWSTHWIAKIPIKQSANGEKEKKLLSYSTYRGLQAPRNHLGAAPFIPTSGVGEEPESTDSSAAFSIATPSVALLVAASSAAFSASSAFEVYSFVAF
jgi:hypothetical protein